MLTNIGGNTVCQVVVISDELYLYMLRMVEGGRTNSRGGHQSRVMLYFPGMPIAYKLMCV